MASAIDLRSQFRLIPRNERDANEGYSIRVWRALSWLERAEDLDQHDYEGRFISAWIAFNALYGRVDEDRRPWGDRESWGAFISMIWRLDHDKHVRRTLFKRQLPVLKLIGSKYLTTQFWEEGESAARQTKKEANQAIVKFGTLKVFRDLFERLYVMRIQVFHGASTKGSKLNRRTLQSSGTILLDIVPVMLTIMISHGAQEDWGNVCFAPI